MNFQELRAAIPATQRMIYLNTGWAGPSPAPVIARMRDVARDESELGPASPDGLALEARVAGEAEAAVASLLNADADEITLTHGTTEGLNIVLHGFPWQPGDELLTCDLEHFALKEPSAVLAERGVVVNVATIPPRAGEDEIVAAIASELTPRTKVVALSHIQYTCGLAFPGRAIADAAHAAGALVLIDGAQTAGHIRLDVRDLDVDYYAISGQKWLMGPTGTGALFMRRDRQPSIVPLLSRGQNPRGVADYGLASLSTPLLAGFAEAMRLHQTLGPAEVETRILGLADHLREGLAKAPGVRVNGPLAGPTACGLVAVATNRDPKWLTDRLWEGYRVVARTVGYPAGVRFSTAPFNTEAELDAAVAAIQRLVGPGTAEP